MNITTRTRRVATGAALAALALPAAALAEPARNTTFSAAGKFTWTTEAHTGVGLFSGSGTNPIEERCSPGRECDDTLIELKGAGVLSAKNIGQSETAIDVGFELLASDSAGTRGEIIKAHDANPPDTNEAVSAELDPGFYILSVDFLLVAAGTIDVEASFEPLAGGAVPGPAPGPAPGPTPAPAPAANVIPTSNVKVKKKIKSKSLKSIGGTAADTDGTIAKVEIAILQLKGDDCKALTRKGSLGSTDDCEEPEDAAFLAAKGTNKWSFKLKKRLPKGKYVVFTRATDDKGGVQTDFENGNRAKFTVTA